MMVGRDDDEPQAITLVHFEAKFVDRLFTFY